jgi:outer membrane protein
MRRFRIMTTTLGVLGVLLMSSIALAQDSGRDTVQLTLADAVQRAVEHNPDLAIVKLDTDVQLARVAEVKGTYSPMFSTILGRSSNVTPPSNFLLGESGVAVKDLFSSTGVKQRLPLGGGTWLAAWDSSRTRTNNPISTFDPTLQSGLQLAFSQPLLRDRKIDQTRQQYIIAKRDQQISELQFRESVVQTVAAVKQAYWTLKATMANVGVQQRSLELAAELARENKLRVDAGSMPVIDLVQAEAEVAQRREGLIRARTDAEDAEDRLRRLIMNPSDPSFWHARLEPVEEPTAPGELPDVDAAVANALKERSDLARAQQELENVRTNVEFLTNQKLPDVRLETSYRGIGLGGTQFLRTGGFPGSVIGTRQRSFGDALGQAFTPDYPTWSVGVTVSYPLGHSFEDANLARARVERQQMLQRIASLRLDTAQSVRQAARQVQSSGERVGAARAGATLAEERLKAEQRRYEVGLSTTFLVTQAQRDLLQAQVNLLQTMLDYESSLVNFQAVQQAPPSTPGGTFNVRGSDVIMVPTPTPHGLFRSDLAGAF